MVGAEDRLSIKAGQTAPELGRLVFDSQFQILDCDDTHCNEELSSYNADVCEHCRGVESCFQQDGDVLCPGWNEAVCPGGLPAHNESAPQKNVVQLRDNVKAIDPAVTTLYACPVSLEDDYGDSAALFIAPYPTSFQDSDVIVSGQAGGVMHIVESIAPVGPYAFVLGNAANIEDVVAYSSFKEEVDPVAMDDETTEEDIPDPVLLSDAINGDLPIQASNVTVVNNDVPVYKCVGNAYISSSEDEWVSTFLVFKAADFNNLASDEGDILAGTESNGWLETVTGGNAGDQFSFVKTDLMRCGEELPDENR
ncbi:Hypp8484 [Branchiostoma lanceolatum]|uniref:Hypp8484 protein n=1 Tax=Branchiostoma lanceolatum TaxID=7740 RepID=A0A8K0EHD2_BRALA|nr:Hypp8484 [Branchiostoma lanceolatum]